MAGIEVDRKPVTVGTSQVSYPDLARQVAEEWKRNGSHRSATDATFDRTVSHCGNATPFGDLIAVIDAIHAPKRVFRVGGATATVPAFGVTFAVNRSWRMGATGKEPEPGPGGRRNRRVPGDYRSGPGGI